MTNSSFSFYIHGLESLLNASDRRPSEILEEINNSEVFDFSSVDFKEKSRYIKAIVDPRE